MVRPCSLVILFLLHEANCAEMPWQFKTDFAAQVWLYKEDAAYHVREKMSQLTYLTLQVKTDGNKGATGKHDKERVTRKKRSGM